jgi:hypothetical protein
MSALVLDSFGVTSLGHEEQVATSGGDDPIVNASGTVTAESWKDWVDYIEKRYPAFRQGVIDGWNAYN